MEQIEINPDFELIVPECEVIQQISSGSFIEANTQQVSLEHLRNETIIPVFSKDNECTIAHYDFINATRKVVKELFPMHKQLEPNIRVSHTIKGRVPSAIGKQVKELLPYEKTIYYERMAFMIEIVGIQENVNGNLLNLIVGGVRALNTENLYSKKSIEKFKVFIGFKNKICTNLCISTDGFSDEIRVTEIPELKRKMEQSFSNYNRDKHLGNMERMSKFSLTTEQVAHLIGKMKLYQYLTPEKRNGVFPINFNDSQINAIARSYYKDSNFSIDSGTNIDLWSLYNLCTGAIKSSYIDSFLQKECQAYAFTQDLTNSLQYEQPNYFLI